MLKTVHMFGYYVRPQDRRLKLGILASEEEGWQYMYRNWKGIERFSPRKYYSKLIFNQYDVEPIRV